MNFLLMFVAEFEKGTHYYLQSSIFSNSKTLFSEGPWNEPLLGKPKSTRLQQQIKQVGSCPKALIENE